MPGYGPEDFYRQAESVVSLQTQLEDAQEELTRIMLECGLTQQEMADALFVTRPAVQQRLARARSS